MKDSKLQEVEELARKILRTYFCESNMDFMISTFADDIIWMGGGGYQKARGRKAVAESFLQGKDEMIAFRMWDEHYECAAVGGGIYVCSCDSILEADPSRGVSMKERQRCTFVFRQKEDGFETVHIHNSIAYAQIEEDELFPVRMAREAYENLKSLALRQDRQLDLMLNHLQGGMVICEVQAPYQVEWMSDNLCRLLGWAGYMEFARCTGNSCRDFIVEEDYEVIVGQIEDQLSRDDSYRAEFRIHSRRGEIFWISEVGKRVVEAGNREVLYAAAIDITERKEQELRLKKVSQEIRQTAYFLTQLYQTVPCGIIQFTADKEHLLLNANRMAWEIYGYTEKEYKSNIITPFQLVLEPDKKRLEQVVGNMTLQSGPVSYTRKCRKKDGSTAWISVVMERLINAEGKDVIQAIYSDVTETKRLQIRKQQEQILENRSLRTAIWNMYQDIMSLNLTADTYNCLMKQSFIPGMEAKGSYDRFHRKMTGMLHPSQQEEYGDRFDREQIRKIFESGKEEIYAEVQQLEEDGRCHWLSVQVIHVDNPYGDDVLAIALIRILDEEKAHKARQEQMLKDALLKAQEANRAKSDFLSRISHDIRTPMNAIMGMSSIGKHYVTDAAKVAECFEKIDSSSRYLLSLLNDVLDMSRIESGRIELNREVFDFRDFVETLSNMILPQTEAKHQEYVLNCQKDVYRHYIGDSLRLNQILMNLLVNAVKFTAKGGKICLDIRAEEQKGTDIILEFRVKDNGIGMSREFLDRIYLPFEQESTDQARNQTGTGLGLSIVSNLVQIMGGTIDVKSQKGEGSEFTVRVPVKTADGEKRNDEADAGEDGGSLLQMRALLVEDNELNREIAQEMLEMKGIVVEAACDGQEAVEMFERSPEHWYDVILMDIRMPRLDGLQATERIRTMDRQDAVSVPVIAMTANAFDADREAAAKAGITEYLIKPLDTGLMFEMLRRIR